MEQLTTNNLFHVNIGHTVHDKQKKVVFNHIVLNSKIYRSFNHIVITKFFQKSLSCDFKLTRNFKYIISFDLKPKKICRDIS